MGINLVHLPIFPSAAAAAAAADAPESTQLAMIQSRQHLNGLLRPWLRGKPNDRLGGAGLAGAGLAGAPGRGSQCGWLGSDPGVVPEVGGYIVRLEGQIANQPRTENRT